MCKLREVIDKHLKNRCLPTHLTHRVIYHFGYLLKEAVRYYVYGYDVEDRELKELFSSIKIDPEDINDYIRLFDILADKYGELYD
ncbi:MAG: hypothetical protein DRJ47_06690 [Thermoprotei archaeon]|nr:MAG: hypothetical protein DRJ47_06690 [Thermoprotei archaeon]